MITRPESIFCCCSNLYKEYMYIAKIKINPRRANILINIVKFEDIIPLLEGNIARVNK